MTAETGPIRVLGLLSGTSVDGIDVAAAELHARGEELTLNPLGHLELAYPEALRADVLASLPPNPSSAERLTMLDTRIGQVFAEAAETGVRQLAGGRADLIASLGQTVFHWVQDSRALGTLQLGQPAWIAERTGLPVLADLRARDVAAGGHGAPLASTLDALWLRGLAEFDGRPCAGLNIGGIANITVVGPDGSTLAYDTGPGNALLDLAAHQVTGGAQRSDTDGALAGRGQVRDDLLRRLLEDPYYSAPPPKSTGKEHFHAGYLDTAVSGVAPIGPEDLLATLTELTAATVARDCARHGVRTVVASGGGVRNPALMSALARRLGDIGLRTSDELGLPQEAKEAYLTALLGWLTWHGLPANLPSATGAAGPRLLGSITPGAGPLRLPPPRTTTVTRMRVAAAQHNR
ncbi:anhydro-N-acetylmuramic acid kinase [Amycolatopsis nigrescens]|uniref:anhydro-N-acetylmuramic acid kinase n=1 Tax=Amycolatopsis nigrescens TaxID=381445 RepID=UPI00035C59F3|nr:anhydro-N-acetylmuramic acid kinase [Amycolatopsis nigrescens]